MNNQFYNLSQPSKNTLDKDRKNRLAAENFLQERNARIAAREQEKILNEKASLMTGAYYANASAMVHSKRRTQALTEEIKYANTAPTIAMTELVAELVESSLLFDVKEYEKYYPNYREDIRETVANLLENANTNFSEMDERTQTLLQYVENILPAAKEGKYLSEGDISRLVKQDKPAEVEAAINSLTGDVANRVTTLVEKEQKRVDEINKELDRAGVQDKIEEVEDQEVPVDDEPDAESEAMNPEQNMEISPEAQKVLDQIQSGELTPEKFEKMIKSGKITPDIAQEVDAVLNQTNPEGEGDMNDIPDPNAPSPSGVMPQQGSGKSIHIAPDGTMGITMPNGQLALNQDGSMDIQLMESLIDDAVISNYLNEDGVEDAYRDATKESAKGIMRGFKWLKASQILSWVLAPMTFGVSIPVAIGSGVVKNNVFEKRLNDRERDLIEYTKNKPDVKELIEKIRNCHTADEAKSYVSQLRNLLKSYYPEMEKAKKENKIVKETPRSGLLESLAVNEAMNMIKEGKEYNSEACISNALLFVTITEAMSELGLLDVTDRTYTEIIRNAGGNIINEATKKVKENVKRLNSIDVERRKVTGVYTKPDDMSQSDYNRALAHIKGKKAAMQIAKEQEEDTNLTIKLGKLDRKFADMFEKDDK